LATSQAFTFIMPLKKATTPGADLASLDINQEGLSLREARNQKGMPLAQHRWKRS
jgi:hypothetical protein